MKPMPMPPASAGRGGGPIPLAFNPHCRTFIRAPAPPLREQLLVRVDVLVHKRPDALAHLPYLRCESEVRHCVSPSPARPGYGAVSSRNAARLILERSAASLGTGTMLT